MGGVHVVVGQHTRDLRTVIMDVGPSSIMNQCPTDFKPVEVNWTYNKLVFPNGGIILGIGGDNPDAARGLSCRARYTTFAATCAPRRRLWPTILSMPLVARGGRHPV